MILTLRPEKIVLGATVASDKGENMKEKTQQGEREKKNRLLVGGRGNWCQQVLITACLACPKKSNTFCVPEFVHPVRCSYFKRCMDFDTLTFWTATG